jgi:hypothetical protein
MLPAGFLDTSICIPAGTVYYLLCMYRGFRLPRLPPLILCRIFTTDTTEKAWPTARSIDPPVKDVEYLRSGGECGRAGLVRLQSTPYVRVCSISGYANYAGIGWI